MKIINYKRKSKSTRQKAVKYIFSIDYNGSI